MAEFTVYAGSASGWDSSGGATGEPDESYAYEDYGSSGFKYLTLGNFGISTALPAGSIITSLRLTTKLKTNALGTPEVWGQIYAKIDGVDQAKSTRTKLSFSGETYTITYSSGDAVDPAKLTDALFNVVVAAEFVNVSSTRRVECDYLEVYVQYSLPQGLEMGCVF